MRKLRMGVFAIVLVLAGCSKSTEPVAGTTGTFQINMIDSPAGYDQVNIVIDSVQAHISSSDTLSGWYTLNRTPKSYDLLKLVNGANAIIGQATVPVGQYSQIRLYVGSGSNVVVNGLTNSLTTPSGSQSGVKLNVNASIEPDITYVLTLDFDASRSIVVTGNNKYSLKPVIRALATATTGLIAGTVTPVSTRPSLWATTSVDTVTTSADTTGGFKVSYLNPATYKLYISPKDTSYRDTTIAGIVVTAGATTQLGTIVLRQK